MALFWFVCVLFCFFTLCQCSHLEQRLCLPPPVSVAVFCFCHMCCPMWRTTSLFVFVLPFRWLTWFRSWTIRLTTETQPEQSCFGWWFLNCALTPWVYLLCLMLFLMFLVSGCCFKVLFETIRKQFIIVTFYLVMTICRKVVLTNEAKCTLRM